MKRAILLLLILIPAFLVTTAIAGGFGGLFAETSALPDPAVILESEPMFYGDDVVADGIIYCGYAFAMPEDIDSFIAEYMLLTGEAGYTTQTAMIGMLENSENVHAWQISAGMFNAYLIPDYRGCLLLLVNPMMDCPLLPTPEPTPAPTPKPTLRPAPTSMSDSAAAYPQSGSSGHWEYIEVQQDCFACFGGTCDLCNGSGVYRAYGSEVPCSRYCNTCDGLGYWYTTQAVWVN